MVLLARIAQGDIVERGFGEAFLEGEHGGGRLLGRVLVGAGQLEHRGDVGQVLLACLDEALFRLQVVVAVRHAESAREDVRDGPGRVVQVLESGDAERHVDADSVEGVDLFLDIGAGRDRTHGREHRLDRLDAERIDRAFVHAGSVEVAGQLLGAAGRPVRFRRDLGEDVAHMFLVDLTRLPAPAPAVHVVRNRMVLAPAAVGVLEKVGAGRNMGVDITRDNAVLRRVRGCRAAGQG